MDEEQATAAADPIDVLFTYHAPEGDQPRRYVEIREAGKELARKIHELCESGPDRTAAIRKVREAVMTANASIATKNAAAHYR
jgi:hypothetical protein